MGHNVSLRKKRWMSYDAAKLTLQQEWKEEVRSRKTYERWHRKVNPVGIPRYPHRVYLKEWTSWADFLDTDNVFERAKPGSYRPYWEAVKFVQGLGLKNVLEYQRACDDGRIPKDIPKAPQNIYPEWRGFKVFLGKNLEAKVAAAREETAVMALCDVSGMPVGYYRLVVEEKGMAVLMQKVDKKPHRVYKWEKQLAPQVKMIMQRFATPHDDGVWLVRNIHDVMFELDSLLEWVKLQ